MRYVKARYKQEQRELAYRVYVTDSLQLAYGLDRRFYNMVYGDEIKREGVTESEVDRNHENVRRLMDKFRD